MMLLALLCSMIGIGCGRSPVTTPTASPVKPADYPIPTPPASEYADDTSCARCHVDLFESWRSTGMARSFFPPEESKAIENFDSRFIHAASKQQFQMSLRDGKYLFRRSETASDGLEINVFEQPVDWILGSGNNARTYLYQTPAGEIYQLPIAWYTEESAWGMAPGFDRPDHEGVTRSVRRECLFCHNAYPDFAPHSDAHGSSQTFPRTLPHGIGCQRCHGPAAEHVRANLDGTTSPESGVINPSRLSAELRDDVCHQCHWQPSVTLFGLRRFGRDDYSFRPGERLADYQVALDIVDGNRLAVDRFEINHHPYRLQQSRCFLESSGQLNCLTCHDPHRTIAPENRAAHYRDACFQCHQQTSCSRTDRPAAPDTSDCVACHMPRRRTQDVVHVIATDHRIGRVPADATSRLAALQEAEPALDDVLLSAPDRGTKLGEIYRAVAVLRATNGRHAAAAQQLARLLEHSPVDAIEPHMDLAAAQVTLGQTSKAIATLEPILQRHPTNAQAAEIFGLAQLKWGSLDIAEQSFRRSLDRDPFRRAAALNLGRLELTRNNPELAVTQLKSVVELHPVLAPAWYYLGEAHARQSHWQPAAESYQRALEIDPHLKEGYFGMERALKELGRPDEAARYRTHALRK